MSVTTDSRDRVRRARARLAETDDFRCVEVSWDVTAATYERERDRFDRQALGGAGVWLTRDDGAVLLARNEGDVGWADPGGKREAGETYAEAAKREVREETGVDCRLTGIREFHEIEHHPPDDSPPIVEAIVIFDGEYVDGTPRARPGEIAAVEWFTAPPERVAYEQVRTRPYPADPEP